MKQLEKTWKLMTFTYRCSICAPLVTLRKSKRHSYSSLARRSYDPSTMVMSCEIPYWRDCCIWGWYTWVFIYVSLVKAAWSEVRWIREPRNISCCSYPKFALETPFFLQWSERRSWPKYYNHCCQLKRNEFPFELFHVSSCKCFEKTLTYYFHISHLSVFTWNT
jgi:hypothetical protein